MTPPSWVWQPPPEGCLGGVQVDEKLTLFVADLDVQKDPVRTRSGPKTDPKSDPSWTPSGPKVRPDPDPKWTRTGNQTPYSKSRVQRSPKKTEERKSEHTELGSECIERF